MIQLNADNALLNKYFGISYAKIYTNYANKDFEEIMKLEASEGNKKAENYESILSEPRKILEIFNLSSLENKFIILQNLNEDDLDSLLPLLNNDQLCMGLDFFTDDKLLAMTKELPIEVLVGMIFEKFQLTDVLDLMEDSAMDTFLKESQVKREYMQSYFESMKETELQGLMQRTKKESYDDKSKEDILDEMSQMKNNEYQSFVTSFGKKDTMNLICGVCEQDEDLLLLFRPDDLVEPMNLLMKGDKIKMLNGLDQEFLIPMVQELPIDLTQIVLTQIDPMDFAKTLSSDYMDALKSVVLFAN